MSNQNLSIKITLKIVITETDHILKDKFLDKVKSVLRCNAYDQFTEEGFDGYVFVPESTGIKVGEYIQESEFDNVKKFPNPENCIYFKHSTQKFYKVIRID